MVSRRAETERFPRAFCHLQEWGNYERDDVQEPGGILSDTAPAANTLYETTQNKSFYTPENATDLMQFCHQVASSVLASSSCMKSVKIRLDTTRSL